MISDEVKEILAQANAMNPKGTTVKLDADVQKPTKTFLTFEELKKILLEGSTLPENKMLPSLTRKQYQQLPGGLTAYQNLIPMMDAIRGTAGVDATDPTSPDDDDDDDAIVEASCPDGFMFNAVLKQCMPIEKPEDDDRGNNEEKNARDTSYQSFVDMIYKSDDFQNSGGSYHDFVNAANNSFYGKTWSFFFNDQKLIGDKLLGTDHYDYGDEFGNLPDDGTGVYNPNYQRPTTAFDANFKPIQPADFYNYPDEDTSAFNEQVNQANQQAQDNDNDTGGTGTGTTFDANLNQKPDSSTEYTSIKASVPSQAFESNRDDEKANNPNRTSAGDAGFTDSKGFSDAFNQGGFVINTDPEGKIIIKDSTGNELVQKEDPIAMQEGGQVPVEQPQEGMPMPSGQPAGFVDDPSATPAPDTPMDAMQGEGQADDVMGELPEGTFVINAMAVQLAGIEELDKMVEKAYESLTENMREKGVDENLVSQLVGSSRSKAGMQDQMVDVAVSNGEYIIPPEIVPIIGEDKLRKINDRGLRKLEKEKKTTEAQPEAPMMMDRGGFAIATDKDGKILTEKVKDASGREVSRILSKDEVKAPEDKGKPSDVSTKDISKSKSFVRKVTPDEIAADLKRRQEKEGMKLSGPDTFIEDTPAQTEGMKLSGPDTPTTDYIVRSEDPEELRDSAKYAEYPDPEELRDAAEYEDPEELRDAAEYAYSGGEGTREITQSFVRPTETGKGRKIQSDTVDTEQGFVNPARGPIGSGIRFSNVKDTINLLNKYVDEGNESGMQNIIDASLDPEQSLNAHPSILDRIKDIMLKLGSFKNKFGVLSIPNHAKKQLRKENNQLRDDLTESQKPQGMMVGSDLFDETGKRRTEVEPVKKNNEVDLYKYNDIKNTFDQFMELSKTSGFKLPSLISTAQADEAQGAALTDPDYKIPIGMKLLPHKNLNVPHFIELLYRLGKKENVTQEIYKDSYNGIAGGLFQLSFEFFAPQELIDQKNSENNTNLKVKKLGNVPKTRRAESIEEFYSPYYQRTMALALLMDHLKTYDGDPVKAIVAYNAGKTRANKLGPNNNFTDFERYVLANNPKDGKRIVRDAKRLVEAVLPEQFNFPAPVINMDLPKPKPKMKIGGFV
jgi:hypothetical protein